MRYVTVLGAGLLVGTALAVIIPEGVNALYMNDLPETHSDHKLVRRELNDVNTVKSDIVPGVDQLKKVDMENHHKHSLDTNHSAIGSNRKQMID